MPAGKHTEFFPIDALCFSIKQIGFRTALQSDQGFYFERLPVAERLYLSRMLCEGLQGVKLFSFFRKAAAPMTQSWKSSR